MQSALPNVKLQEVTFGGHHTSFNGSDQTSNTPKRSVVQSEKGFFHIGVVHCEYKTLLVINLNDGRTRVFLLAFKTCPNGFFKHS